jgi:hypothetical protein
MFQIAHIRKNITLQACVHVSDCTYLEKYSVADVFHEIHEEISKGFFVTYRPRPIFGADSYKFDFSSPVGD